MMFYGSLRGPTRYVVWVNTRCWEVGKKCVQTDVLVLYIFTLPTLPTLRST
jgi:hypothetical protein